MLKEMATGGELAGSARKKWYHDENGDLYVWKTARGTVASFQLSFMETDSEDRQEWWVQWAGHGLRVGQVDSKEVDSRVHDLKAPVVEGATISAKRIRTKAQAYLERNGGELPDGLRRFLQKHV